MNILVTGGCGLIGHNVVAKFRNLGHTVQVVDTMTDYGLVPADELRYLMSERQKKINTPVTPICVSSPLMAGIIANYKPEIIVHLASFPRQKVVNVNPQAGARVMVEGLLNLLENSVKTGVRRFVYASSSMVYGDFTSDVTEDYVCRPQGQYGIMKYTGEKLVQDYTRKFGIEHTILRPSAVYGELDVQDRVVSQFMLAALRGGVLKVNGPDETLDFTYVDDAADGFVAASLSPKAKNGVYNITKSHSTTLLDAAKMAVRIAGSGTIDCGTRDPDFPSRGALNISAARRDFNFSPAIDVEEGFRRYHRWFKESPYWSQKLAK